MCFKYIITLFSISESLLLTVFTVTEVSKHIVALL